MKKGGLYVRMSIIKNGVVMGKAGKNGARVCVVNFKATEKERRIIENYARKQKLTVSEYVREAVFYDMFLAGHTEAYKLIISGVATGVASKAKATVQAVLKRNNQISSEDEETHSSETTKKGGVDNSKHKGAICI